MTADQIKARLKEGCSLFGFDYNGKTGGVDPYWSEDKGDVFALFYAGNETEVYGVDAVMTTPFIDGKTLTEVLDDLTINEY